MIITLLFLHINFVCVGVFSTTQKHASDVSASRMCLQLISTALCSPRSTVRWKSNGWGIYGTLSRSFPTCFYLSYIYIAQKFYLPHFLHSQNSRASLRSLLLSHKLSLAIFSFFTLLGPLYLSFYLDPSFPRPV